MKIARLTLLVLLLAAVTHVTFAADAVAWDSSGDALLSGTYNFREVMWGNNGDLHRVAIYGSIQFDGVGGYTLSSSVMDSNNAGSTQSFSTTGAYRISASGMGFLDDPIRQQRRPAPPAPCGGWFPRRFSSAAARTIESTTCSSRRSYLRGLLPPPPIEFQRKLLGGGRKYPECSGQRRRATCCFA